MEAADQIDCVPLPWAYHPLGFLREYKSTRKTIRRLIQDSSYLSFAIGGLFGDWAAVACREAWKMRRPYSVWTDRVEHEVIRRSSTSYRWKRRLMNMGHSGRNFSDDAVFRHRSDLIKQFLS